MKFRNFWSPKGRQAFYFWGSLENFGVRDSNIGVQESPA